ncbi:hypothetical protein SNE40_009949 [Patella caerulea]|uniref:ABC1 atypical kinase-like domain-containing protein n=1 Tax=Patella caerulea TaxID=87958 RepID=A0AAN8PTK1_PATCE
MSRRSDLLGIIRGLEQVTRALAENQGKELSRAWKNSSLKASVGNAGFQFENAVSSAIVKRQEVARNVQDTVYDISNQASAVVETVKTKITAASQSLQYKDVKSDDLDTDIRPPPPPEVSPLSDDYIIQASSADIVDPPSTNDSSIPPTSTTDNVTPPINISSASIYPSTSTYPQSKSKKTATSDQTNFRTSTKTTSGAVKFSTPTAAAANILNTAGDTLKAAAKQASKIPVPNFQQSLNARARERKVPATRISRLMSYGGLAAGLGVGAISEITKRTFGLSDNAKGTAILDNSPFLTEANAERIVNTLCRVRGAALKLGQMLSIQDNALINPQLQKIFERVRQSADFMPISQMTKVLNKELGYDWRNKFQSFEDKPFAAASIGQVHKGVLYDGREVAVKIQYPGVAKSIDSDINNLMSVLNVWQILPEGMYIDSVMKVAKRELAWEVDYIREAESGKKFRELLQDDHMLYVPDVIEDLSTDQILTTEFIYGIPLDQCVDLDQDTRNRLCFEICFRCWTYYYIFSILCTTHGTISYKYHMTINKVP